MFELRLVKKTVDKAGNIVPERDPYGCIKYYDTFRTESAYDLWKFFESKQSLKKPKKKKPNK